MLIANIVLKLDHVRSYVPKKKDKSGDRPSSTVTAATANHEDHKETSSTASHSR
jgi:hypothetical protein